MVHVRRVYHVYVTLHYTTSGEYIMTVTRMLKIGVQNNKVNYTSLRLKVKVSGFTNILEMVCFSF